MGGAVQPVTPPGHFEIIDDASHTGPMSRAGRRVNWPRPRAAGQTRPCPWMSCSGREKITGSGGSTHLQPSPRPSFGGAAPCRPRCAAAVIE